MKHITKSTIAMVVYFVAISTVVQARTEVSLPTVKTVEEALELLDTYKGDAENFRIGIPEQLFDPAGVTAARVVDRALSRGWEPDGFFRALEYRVYRFKANESKPNKVLQRARSEQLASEH